MAGDLVVYENVVAIVDTEGKDAQVQIGTMIKVGDCWRLIDAPTVPDASAKQTEVAGSGFFFVNPPLKNPAQPNEPVAGGPNEKTQKLMDELQKLDDAIARADGREAQAQLNEQRADYFEQVIKEIGDKERPQWIRQMADTVSAAVQSGTYPKGASGSSGSAQSLEKNPADGDLAAYVEFRELTAEYVAGLATAEPRICQSARRMAQEPRGVRGPASESARRRRRHAPAWHRRGIRGTGRQSQALVSADRRQLRRHPGRQESGRARSAGSTASARRSSWPAAARPANRSISRSSRGKFVLIHYWATTSEPCKVDLAELKELQAKYAADGFALIGVSLDANRRIARRLSFEEPASLAATLRAGRTRQPLRQ